MKAIGYTQCRECGGIYRGYAPRGWTAGDELATWSHGLEATHGWGKADKCPGSYRPGQDSRLDADLEASKQPLPPKATA